MSTIRPFCMDDLLKFNNINLDVLTETYNMSFYMSYMSRWPEAFTGKALYFVDPAVTAWHPKFLTLRPISLVAESSNGELMGYMLGKAEGEGKLWHGHVSAVTVAPRYRRLGLARTLMDDFEEMCIHQYNAYFVDLFVRASNSLAIQMYETFGYSVYRRVLGYYSGELPEDAFDMRKALPLDVDKESVVPLGHPIRPEDLEW